MPPKANKKAVKGCQIKNPGRPSTSRRSPSPTSSERSAGRASVDSFDNLHRDEIADLGMQMEQGEILADTDDEAPVAVSQEVQQLINSLQSSQKELTEKIVELRTQVDSSNSNLTWKKDGLKKQYDIAQSVLNQCKKALVSLKANNSPGAQRQVQAGIDILSERMKELRIADTSDAGWETVNVYRSNPVADDSDDDRRIRKAEKLAKEKVAAKSRRNRPNRRFSAYRRPFNRGEGFNREQRDFPYRNFGSGRCQDNQQRGAYIPDRRRPSPNTLCFFCGQPGHWQSNCPNKNDRRDANKS